MPVPPFLTKTTSRRTFLLQTVFVGGGIILSTPLKAAMAVTAGHGSSGMSSANAEIDVRTGWDKQAIKVLAKRLNAHKGSPKFVSKWHQQSVVVQDNLAQQQLATVAMNASLKTEYFVAMSRPAAQPTSDAEAAQIVHSLSIWRVRRATARESQPESVVKRIYSISFRDATLIRNSIHFAADTMSQRPEIMQYYHKLTV